MHHLEFAPGSRFILRTGVGRGRHALTAFDAALVAAGVGNFNLLKVSSILPPGAIADTVVALSAGARLPIAYGAEITDEPGHRISASVAVGVPVDPAANGVIMEYHSHGSAADADRIVREMAVEAMALRGIAVREVVSAAVEAVSENTPTAVFASVALVPVECYR